MKLGDSIGARTLRRTAREIRRVLDKLPRRIAISGGEVVCGGVKLHFPKDIGISYTTNLFWHGEGGYEPTTTQILIDFIKSARHFMDVGSNIGLYSVLARKLAPSIRVDAFEAVPTIFAKNIEFHRANNVSHDGVMQKGASNEDGLTKIYLPLFEGAVEEDQTATLRTDSWQHERDQRQEITVETIKIDSFLSARPAMTPLLMKIDVEDHEAAVLEGARETILHNRPVILCEMLPREHGNQQTWKILDACNYQTFAITADGLFRFEAADGFLEREIKDFLCLPRELSAQFRNYISFSSLSEIRKNWALEKGAAVEATAPFV